MDLLLLAGLGSVFLAFSLVFVTIAFGSFARTGVAQALADIDRVYAPGAVIRGGSLGDRALRPLMRVFSAIGRGLTPRSAVAWMHRWLDFAGNPNGWPPERIFEAQGLGLVAGAFFGALVGMLVSVIFGYAMVALVLVAMLIFAAVGLWLPYFVVLDLGQRRQEKIRMTVPDAVDMLTLSVDAGVGFDAALGHVANGTTGPLARELARALHEMQMGKQRAEALRAMADRTAVRELRTIAVAVVQATELGVPLTGVLREQANEMRVRRRQRAEEQARKVPVKVLLPLIFCLFPALFIVVLGPGVLRIMDAFGN